MISLFEPDFIEKNLFWKYQKIEMTMQTEKRILARHFEEVQTLYLFLAEIRSCIIWCKNDSKIPVTVGKGFFGGGGLFLFCFALFCFLIGA